MTKPKIRTKATICTLCGRHPIVDFDGTLRCDCGHTMKPGEFLDKRVREAVDAIAGWR